MDFKEFIMCDTPSSSLFLKALEDQKELKEKYKNDAGLLYALKLCFNIEDIDTEASQSLVDGKNDKKCDLVYVNYERRVAVIAQSYWAEVPGKKAAKGNKASDLNTAVNWLFSCLNNATIPENLRDAAIQLEDALTTDEASRVNSIEIWYVHNCMESKNIAEELTRVGDGLKRCLNDSKFQGKQFNVIPIEVGLKKLDEWYRSRQSQISVDKTIEVPIKGGYKIGSEKWDAYCTAVPLSWIYNIYQIYERQLWSANVRDYLGSRSSDANINHSIKKTASNEPDDFWTFNNGVTAVVHAFEKVKGKRNKLSITGLSIVNGAQSSGAIGSLNKEPQNGYIPIRFIKCKDDELLGKIVKYNNSQNKIAPADFRSTDRVQERLRKEFSDINLPFSYNGGRRGGDGDTISRVRNLIPSETAAQSLSAFHLRPDIAYHKKKLIWESDTHYNRIFNDGTSAKHIIFVYSLHQAIKKRQSDLKDKEELSKQEKKQAAFLNRRGAIYILQSAISSSLESILDDSISNRFALHFKNTQLLEEKLFGLWETILEPCLSFCEHLESPLNNSLRNTQNIETALGEYSNFINATKSVNTSIFKKFSELVSIESE
ncbi:AIPR family protein [Pleurocapsales cyanobacterium LEGE 10410]|nr:AIPR family protein [Pleurocapsales cyanobacterium LEGE 10410]